RRKSLLSGGKKTAEIAAHIVEQRLRAGREICVALVDRLRHRIADVALHQHDDVPETALVWAVRALQQSVYLAVRSIVVLRHPPIDEMVVTGLRPIYEIGFKGIAVGRDVGCITDVARLPGDRARLVPRALIVGTTP